MNTFCRMPGSVLNSLLQGGLGGCRDEQQGTFYPVIINCIFMVIF